MYIVKKTMEIAGAHRLELSYPSKCSELHGHNWMITVYCKSKELNEDGMVIDFARVKELIHGKLDHSFLNDVVPCNPTAENAAKWICDQIPQCFRVDIAESRNNIATYIEDED